MSSNISKLKRLLLPGVECCCINTDSIKKKSIENISGKRAEVAEIESHNPIHDDTERFQTHETVKIGGTTS